MRRRDLEGPIHKAILQYLRLQYPQAVIHHSSNELNLKGDRTSKAIAQNKAKALGMMTGWPDLQMLWNGHLYCFEVKSPNGRLSDAQAQVGAEIQAAGGSFYVVRSVEDVKAAMKSRHGVVNIPFAGVINS